MELADIRKEIDEIDSQLLPLFLRRMKCAEQVAAVKKEKNLPVFNAQREQEILDRAAEKAGEYGQAVRGIYSTMMSVSRERQYQLLESGGALRELTASSMENLPTDGAKVACPGVVGAFTHRAACTVFPNGEMTFHPHFDQVFEAVEQGAADFGVIPVENSSAGSVVDVYDLILRYRFYIVRAVTLPVRHFLCGTENSEEIQIVFSHPQALAQCSDFLNQKGWKKQEYSNTAAAAKMLSLERLHHAAVICSKEAAEKYGLTVLEENIQNARDNCTRFIVISRTPCLPQNADKISLCFSLPNMPGALHQVLGRFALNGLNLTKIESRPIPGKAFEYDFYLDFTGNLHESHTLELLCSLSEELPRFTFLGNYSETKEL